VELKVYIPVTVDLADDYIPPLIRRLADSVGKDGETLPASRGQIVRQAVLDGLLHGLDRLIGKDGSVDLLCDPSGESPIIQEGKTVTVGELTQYIGSIRKK